MTEFLKDLSTDHAFMFMLHDRIIQLEDMVVQLQKKSENSRHEWLKFVFKSSCPTFDLMFLRNTLSSCVNYVFHDRASTNPLFASWLWWLDEENIFTIHVYVRFANPRCILEWEHPLLAKIKPTTCGDVKLILKDRLSYLDSFPEPSEPYGLDIWCKGGDIVEYPLSDTWGNDAFLDSPNYRHPCFSQNDARDRLLVLIKTRHWSLLFHTET